MKVNIFQRQEELKGWNQEIITNSTCLVLGVGGLGSTISMDLCRLGVAKIHLLDMDTVDWHNLNRQILFRSEHVNHFKVESAVEELNRHHNTKTQLVKHNCNALENWQLIIQLIKESDIIFNTIDHGDYFDYAVCQIAKKYCKPLVLGGTEPFYGHTVSYFLQGIRECDPTYWDCHDLKTPDLIVKTTELEVQESITYLPKDSHPVVGGSTVYSAGTCSHLMVCAMVNYMFHLNNAERPDPPKQLIFNLMTMDCDKWFGTTDNATDNAITIKQQSSEITTPSLLQSSIKLEKSTNKLGCAFTSGVLGGISIGAGIFTTIVLGVYLFF